MHIITRTQNLPDGSKCPVWKLKRLGIPSASENGCIITPKRHDYSASAEDYINRLVDQVQRPWAYTGDDDDRWKGNKHTRRGNDLEDEAAGTYAFDTNQSIEVTGFVLSDCRRFGCSPDRLVGDDGGLEVKCPDGPTMSAWTRLYRRTGSIPHEHLPQVHGSLIVTGRAWWDFLAYCRGYDSLIIRVTPNDFTDKLRQHLETFHEAYVAALADYGLTHPGLTLEPAE
jgi:hypothetical protein